MAIKHGHHVPLVFLNKLVDHLDKISKRYSSDLESILSHMVENYLGICETKGHECILKNTISSAEGYLPLVC